MMGKKISLNPELDKKGLEDLLKSHGILLEHRVHNALFKYFDRAEVNVDILFRKIGDQIQVSEEDEAVETDVCFFVKKSYPAGNLDIRSKGSTLVFKERRPSYSIVFYFIIQCKGHPHSGILLTRIAAGASEKKELLHYFNNVEAIELEEDIIYNVDWAYFFNKLGKKDDEVYKEDKQKFYKALIQINKSLTAYEGIGSKYSKNSYSRIIPIIITDCPLYTMQIEQAKVIIGSVPWVKFDQTTNRKYDFQPSNHKSDYVYVLNYSYIESFLIQIMNRKFLSYPAYSGASRHSIPIEVAT